MFLFKYLVLTVIFLNGYVCSAPSNLSASHKNKKYGGRNNQEPIHPRVQKKPDSLTIDIEFEATTGTITKFLNSKNQTKVVLPEMYKGVRVKNIGPESFVNAPFKEIILPKSLLSIDDRAFAYCKNLEKIWIPNSVTNIGYKSFFYCSNLTNLELPINLQKIDGLCFSGCFKLLDLIFPTTLTKIGKEAFSDCDAFVEINLPPSITKINEGAFKGCSNLKKIKLPQQLKKISSRMFEECKKLETIILPKSLDTIEDNAFWGCAILNNVFVPSNVTFIGIGVFDECIGLTKLKIDSPYPPILGASFVNTSLNTIEVPVASIETYRNAKIWMRYSPLYVGLMFNFSEE